MKIRGVGCLAMLVVTACSSVANKDDGSGGSGGGGSAGDGGAGASSSSGGPVAKGSPAPVIKSDCAPANVVMGVAQSVALKSGIYAMNMVAADVNADGKVDLVVLESSPAGIEVFLSNGDGTFAKGAFYEQRGSNGPGMAAGDFDGDGRADIAINSFGSVSVDNSVDIILNKGDGTFGGLAKNAEVTSTNLYDIVAADLNGDGKSDLLYHGQEGSGSALASGGGQLATASANPGNLGDSFAIGDLNGDGAADAVVYTNNTMCVMLNNGSGQFATPVCYPGLQSIPMDYLTIGDVNGDGKPDVMGAYDGHSGTVDASNIALFLGKGDGTFEDRKPVKLTKTMTAFHLMDMNNDGKADIVAGSQYGGSVVEVLLSNGDGTFADKALEYAAGSEVGTTKSALEIADFGGNGLRGIAMFNGTKNAVDVINATCKK